MLAWSAMITAQSVLVTQLANQVCNCMETNDRTTPPSEQARECVRIVGLRNKNELLEELSLNPANPVELSMLSDRMADLLSQNCPVLSTLRLDDFERELRWSDGNTVRTVDAGVLRYKFPKSPVADPSDVTVSEPPIVWRIGGTVSGRPGRGELRLRLPDGRIQHFEYPSSISRKIDLVEGQSITVVCDRQWRKSLSDGIVALVVRAIE